MNAAQLNDLFMYENGKLLVNKPNLRSKLKHGDRAGSLNNYGYRAIRIQNKVYLEHRLIYTMFHNDCPKSLDHINGNKLDNHIENLRPCTATQNQQNKKLSKVNKSGYKGVCWRNEKQSWRVAIRVNGKRIEIGSFRNLELAGLVADMAREKYHGNFCRHI